MFGLGDTELLLILIFAFLLFGPDKLPSMGRTIGRGIKQFRQASDSVTKVVKTEVLNPLSEAAKTEAGTPAMPAGAAGASEGVPQLQERPTETFAERRARLAREREEREAAAAAEAALGMDAVASADERDPIAAVPAVGDRGVAVTETVETIEKQVPARASVASMWGLDEGDAGAPEPEPAPVESGEEDAAVRTA